MDKWEREENKARKRGEGRKEMRKGERKEGSGQKRRKEDK